MSIFKLILLLDLGCLVVAGLLLLAPKLMGRPAARLGWVGKILLVTGLLLPLVAAGVVLAVAGPADFALNPAPPTVAAGNSAAPPFTLNTLAGPPVTLAQLSGKPAIINFWATWCPPCIQELPALDQAFAARRGQINFLAINVKEDSRTVQAFAQNQSLHLPVAIDVDGAVTNWFQVRGLPTTIFLNANGVIVGRHLGSMTATELNQNLDLLLNTP